MNSSIKKYTLGSLVSVMSVAAVSNVSAAGAPPYQFAGQYEFSGCTENVEAYVAISVAAGTLDVVTDSGSATIDSNIFSDSVKVPFPVSCDADGQVVMTENDVDAFNQQLEDACDDLFPPQDDLAADLNSVMCPVLEWGIAGIVETAQAGTPQFVVTSIDAQIEELVGNNSIYRSWLFGSYEGLLLSQNTRYDGFDFNINTPIQSYGRIRTGRNAINIDALGGIMFAGGALACGYGNRDVAKPYYHADHVMVNSEYRHGFECIAEYNGQNVAFEIAPIYKVEYSLDKTQ